MHGQVTFVVQFGIGPLFEAVAEDDDAAAGGYLQVEFDMPVTEDIVIAVVMLFLLVLGKEFENPVPYKGENKEELVLFAKDQEKQNNHRDYYIFGHRHIELDLQLEGGSRVIILGDTFQQWTYAKLDHHGRLTMHTYEPKSGTTESV